MILLSGTEAAQDFAAALKKTVAQLRRRGIKPGLAIIIVGSDPASQTYVRIKERAARELGIAVSVIRFPASTSSRVLIASIARLNALKTIHGIIVQLPLPKKTQEETNNILDTIAPQKDVDGLTSVNQGRLFRESPALVSATAQGVLELLRRHRVPVRGRHAVVVGKSFLVGKPAAFLLSKEGATVTICHKDTKNLAAFTKTADILVSATGSPGLIRGSMVRNGAAVVDVGITRRGKKLFGDVAFESVRKKAGYLTPVPGGVGPLTVVMLMRNVVSAAKAQKRRRAAKRA